MSGDGGGSKRPEESEELEESEKPERGRLGDALTTLLQASPVSKTAAARAVGVSPSTLRRWCAGESAPKTGTRQEAQFWALIDHVEARCGRPHRSGDEWASLLRKAQAEAAAHRGRMLSKGPDPEGSFVRAHHAFPRADGRLVGRDAERAVMADFIRGSGPFAAPYLCWCARFPAGKTALLAELVSSPPSYADVVSFRVSGAHGTVSRAAFVAAVGEQVRAFLYPDDPVVLDPQGPRDWDQLLGQAAEKSRRRGRTFVLVVDGLDSDLAWSGERFGEGVPGLADLDDAPGPTDRADHPGPTDLAAGGDGGAGRCGSIAGLLPVRPGPHLRIVVSIRRSECFPGDLPVDHPLRRREGERELAASAPAVAAAGRRVAEWLDRLYATPPGREVMELLTVAGGGLRAVDLAELVGASVDRVERLLHGPAGRCLVREDPLTGTYSLALAETPAAVRRRMGSAGPAVRESQLHTWGDRWQAAGWPPQTPPYLLRDYLRLLDDPARRDAYVLDGRRQARLAATVGPDVALAQLDTLAEESDAPHLARAALLAAARTELWHGAPHVPAGIPGLLVHSGAVDRACSLARAPRGPVVKAARLTEVAVALLDTERWPGTDAQRARRKPAAPIAPPGASASPSASSTDTRSRAVALAREAVVCVRRAGRTGPHPAADSDAYAELAEAAHALHRLGTPEAAGNSREEYSGRGPRELANAAPEHLPEVVAAARALLQGVVRSGATDVESVVAAASVLLADPGPAQGGGRPAGGAEDEGPGGGMDGGGPALAGRDNEPPGDRGSEGRGPEGRGPEGRGPNWVAALRERAEQLSAGGPAAQAAAVHIWGLLGRHLLPHRAEAQPCDCPRCRVLALCATELDPSQSLYAVDVLALAASALADQPRAIQRKARQLLRVGLDRLSEALAAPEALSLADQAHLRRELSTTLQRLAQAVDDTGVGQHALDEIKKLVAGIPATLRIGVLGDDVTERARETAAAGERFRAVDAARRSEAHSRRLHGRGAGPPDTAQPASGATPAHRPLPVQGDGLGAAPEGADPPPEYVVLSQQAERLLWDGKRRLGHERLMAALHCLPPAEGPSSDGPGAADGDWTLPLAQAMGAAGEFAAAEGLVGSLPGADRARHLAALALGCALGGRRDEAVRYGREAARLVAGAPTPAVRAAVAQALAYAGDAAAAEELASRGEPGESADECAVRVRRARAAIAAGIVHTDPDRAAQLVQPAVEKLKERIDAGSPLDTLPQLAELLLAYPNVREPSPLLVDALRRATERTRRRAGYGLPVDTSAVLTLLDRLGLGSGTYGATGALGYAGAGPAGMGHAVGRAFGRAPGQWPPEGGHDDDARATLAVLSAVDGDVAGARRLATAAPTQAARALALASVASYLAGLPTPPPAHRPSAHATARLCLALAHAAGGGAAPDLDTARVLAAQTLAGEGWSHAIPLLPLVAPEALGPLGALAAGHAGRRASRCA